MGSEEQDKYVTYPVAMRLLGVGTNAMSRLFETGELPYKEHPFDKRKKLVKLSDINKLRNSGVPADPTVHHIVTTWTIYALIDPRNNLIRYVGRTVRMKVRLQQHLEEVAVNPEKTRWLRELKKQGLTPNMEILETLECKGNEAEERERYWIQSLLSKGAPLTNIRGV
jgi:hypothetical protein